MIMLVVAALPLLPQQRPSLAHLRSEVARVAMAQIDKPDPAWQPAQRDCAGLVRFAYRQAFAALRSDRLQMPLFLRGPWRDGRGDFADAATLLSLSFVSLGRDEDAEALAQSGDLLAFLDADNFHLMILVRAEDRARTEPLVVYSPGNGTSEVRQGGLESLKRTAPVEWRPLAQNTRFLGYFRFKEWAEQ